MARESPATATTAGELSDPGLLADELADTRARTLELISRIAAEDLERSHSPLLSPLVWDLGHIAAYEDLWLAHRAGRRPLLRPELAEVYDAFETPRAIRSGVSFLRGGEVYAYLDEVRDRTLELLAEGANEDGPLFELVIRHEQQHNETMLQTIQLAHLIALAEEPAEVCRSTTGLTGLELVEVPAGACTIGSDEHGFAYDNERPRHRTRLGRYLIGRAPVTNATYLSFVEGGGYERREWWSQEGWAWKEEYDITRPMAWTEDLREEWRLGRLEPLHPDRPVVHVSWFEADAFARANSARLPSEQEWERAATWDQHHGEALPAPWGDAPTEPGRHANLDHRRCGPGLVGSLPEGASPCGCLGMIGDVWEWTSSAFGGYPGFVAHPYREYSEVFFGDGYRVLRGGSWASRVRSVTARFRNWDLPERRQIFAGLRLARDL